MKWLKIKKYLKIFSVIICSLFIFSNKANAYEFSYNNINFDTNEILSNIKSQYSNIDFDNVYRFHFAYILGDKVYFVTHDAPDMTRISTGETISDKSTILPYDDDIVIHPGASSGGSTWNAWHNVYYYTYDINTGEEVVSVSYGSKPSNRVYFDYTGDKLENETYEEYINRKVLYSNVNFTIADALSNENYYRPYNTESIENPLNYRMQFNNDVSPDLKQITFDFPKAAIINFNLKSRIEIGNWSLISEELPVYLNQKIIGYDSNQIEYDMTDYFNIKVDTTDYLTTKELNFSYSLVQEIPDNIIRFKIYYDFDIPVNNYFFNVFDNFIEGTTFWNYIENFLVGYNKYEFPQGYDLAIIRSKNFNDLESFFISDKLYFTSPEYDFNLKLYDFNNKIEKYNFNSLTQYLFNPVYLKIPIKIDETNNIFPVLTKPMNNESGIFYLKDDLFVQFINSENLDSIIDGIPEDQFNDNNDLNIDSDIGNLNPPQQDEQSLTVFFNEFWKIFEKFSNILSYITSCFAEFFYTLPTTIQIFLCVTFAFIILKMLVFFIL